MVSSVRSNDGDVLLSLSLSSRYIVNDGAGIDCNTPYFGVAMLSASTWPHYVLSLP